MTFPLSSKLAVFASADSPLDRAKDFAQANGLVLTLSEQAGEFIAGALATEPPYALCYQGRSVAIIQTGKGAPGPVSASFLTGQVEHRRKFGGGKGQMIAKAVGLSNGVLPTVLDATAGLGRDAFVLASLGCQVQMLERAPVIAELLRVALAEARSADISPIVERMSLLETDAAQWLDRQTGKVADVIYLDPMYPHREKSALVKKEMRLFAELLADDQLNPEQSDAKLLAAALATAAYRVVVKRPRKGETIAGPRPSFELTGKSCRFDIYALKSMAELRAKSRSEELLL